MKLLLFSLAKSEYILIFNFAKTNQHTFRSTCQILRRSYTVKYKYFSFGV